MFVVKTDFNYGKFAPSHLILSSFTSAFHSSYRFLINYYHLELFIVRISDVNFWYSQLEAEGEQKLSNASD